MKSFKTAFWKMGTLALLLSMSLTVGSYGEPASNPATFNLSATLQIKFQIKTIPINGYMTLKGTVTLKSPDGNVTNPAFNLNTAINSDGATGYVTITPPSTWKNQPKSSQTGAITVTIKGITASGGGKNYNLNDVSESVNAVFSSQGYTNSTELTVWYN